VTGASSGIGLALARMLGEEGHGLTVASRRPEKIEAAAEELRGAGHDVEVIAGNMADEEAVKSVVAAHRDRFGRLDVLVNNAAWNIGIPFPELDALTVEIWDRIFNTNVRGPFQLARAAAVPMRNAGAGRIVNITSVAGLGPTGSSIAYASSKAALIHLTRCLAVALAPAITVNCVAPGLIEGTRMAARLPQSVVDRARAGVVLGRTSSAVDIAEQVVTFCRSDSITGQVLVVDGGMLFH
jgi:3-oxoacyl-[acyl-carrier protein] reductase